MTFRARLVIATVFLTALTLGLAFFGLWLQFARLQEAYVDRDLLAVAYAEGVEAPGLGFSFNAGPGPAKADVGPLTRHGVIYGDTDRPLSATAPFDAKIPSRASLAHEHGECFDFYYEGRHYRGVFGPIPGHPKKAILIATLREELDARSKARRDAMAVAFFIALVWTSLVAYLLARRLTRDHSRIAEVAHRVTSGDLSARVGARSGDREIMQLSTDIDDMVDTIAMLMSAQRRFLANAAHELRSPLTKLYGELQFAVRKERDAAELRRAIHSALDSTRALKELADDLLSLAKASTGEESEDSTLLPIVENAVDLSRARAEELGVSFELEGLDLTVNGRPNDLARLFRNLIENAVTHSPKGGLVRVTGSREGNTAVVVVEDEGDGVPKEDRDRIFEPFFRGRKSRARAVGGSGLGLGIAREVARNHGGNLVLGTSMWGARFVVELPIYATRPSRVSGA